MTSTTNVSAAEAAEGAARWDDAIAAYEASLAGGEDVDEAAVLTALGRCYWNISQARPAWRFLRRAIAICQERGDGVGQARATTEILRIWGPPARHRAMAEDALAALGDGDPYLRARILLELSFQNESDEQLDEALAIADEHGYDDIRTTRTQRRGWAALEEGKIDEAVALFEEAHVTYARLGVHQQASGVLRGAGFNLIELGRLDDGYDMARRSFEYASGVNLHFQAQLALMDMIGVAFARDEFERCEELLAQAPTGSDFRGDLYRMWMAEARGDIDGALRLMVDPERGGNTPTAVGQIHASAAGIFFRAGRRDAAAQALRAWATVERQDDEAPWMEAPALVECLADLAEEGLARSIDAALRRRDERSKARAEFAVLQGRPLAPLRAAVALRLGRRDEAEQHYRDGLAWCEAQRCPRDAEVCRRGLAAL